MFVKCPNGHLFYTNEYEFLKPIFLMNSLVVSIVKQNQNETPTCVIVTFRNKLPIKIVVFFLILYEFKVSAIFIKTKIDCLDEK